MVEQCNLEKEIHTCISFLFLFDKDISCKGGKSAKDRLTVMFACSATGEKLTNPAASKTSEKETSQSAMNLTKRHR